MAKTNEIRVVVKRAGHLATTEMLVNDLEHAQGIVGGYIEMVPIGNGVYMICNEEGKLNGLRPNMLFPDDIIVGDVFFCGEDGEGNFASLSDEQMNLAKELAYQRSLVMVNKG